ncbi:MAG: DUF1156 domain-containing protein [Nitrospiraceae bacterium]|nr:DUF1156 domain-containing protein [Nitrospiraceae bacterium]
MIERDFDIPFIANLALREKQIQQNYRPIIAVHKWFARRPGTLFRGLILSEFVDKPLREVFYESNDLSGLVVADPFMGGGTPLIEANRVGCDVIGYDINPMAYWIVQQELEYLDLNAYRKASDELLIKLEHEIGGSYRTKCLICGAGGAQVKYFLWVKQHACAFCGKENDLFPGYLLAEDRRHPKNVMVCSACGELNEVENRGQPGRCTACGELLNISGPARRNKYSCKHCGRGNAYPGKSPKSPGHRMYAIEYYCHKCKPAHKGRFFKKPEKADLLRYKEAAASFAGLSAKFVPDDKILDGDETARLHRWGYRRYRDMFNARQLLGLELSCRAIAGVSDDRVRNALATNLSDLLRYQNMLCRYDTMALKSLDIFSVHGFPVGLMQCESNILGIANGAGVSVGSGGWRNIIEKYYKAKAYCGAPFEIRHVRDRKIQVPISHEWIGDRQNGNVSSVRRKITLFAQSATGAGLPPASVDAVLTDPPYFGNVQYAELIDFCYVWLRRLVGAKQLAFARDTTRDALELTGNVTMDRGLAHFADGLSKAFQKMTRALKDGHPLVFTYHHNNFEAYYPIVVALLDSGLVCSASLPCPAEMGGSIHINGTGSSIVDTVFVCRSTGMVPRKWLPDKPQGIAGLVREDIENLRRADLEETKGDVRCIIYGHLIRLAVWRLRHLWDRTLPVSKKIGLIAEEVEVLGGPVAVENSLSEVMAESAPYRMNMAREAKAHYAEEGDGIPF